MNRIDRLQAIIIQLQTKKVVRAYEIADRFNISLRTVYRDIRAIEEAGVPIGAEAGIGYFLSENYNLPPIMLSQNEASSILLAGKFLPYLADKRIQESFDSAMNKIKAVLKPDQKEEIAKLESSINVASYFSTPNIPDSIYIQEIQHALINNQLVNIQYHSNYKKQNTQRTIEPISLLYYANNWHLIAFCRLRNEFRDFRLDRISELELMNEKYKREIDKDYQHYMQIQKESISLQQIYLEFPPGIAEAIKEIKYWYGFVNQEISAKNNWIKMNFISPDLQMFARWVISFGAQVNVISPKELTNKLIGLSEELYKKYQS